jgi:DNA processing protein
MNTHILFKILQRRLKFRNPNHLLEVPTDFKPTQAEVESAETYLHQLSEKNIRFTNPGEPDYPVAFRSMKEPPLFLEYDGPPLWLRSDFISIVGSRDVSGMTEAWMKSHVSNFITMASVGIVSGGAVGVDQLAHLLAIKAKSPTVFVLPSGLENLYPRSLHLFKNKNHSENCCFLSEFELDQKIHKSHFYFRNRLIAALSAMTLVTQASLKSGSLLTVHHCLENGRPVLVVPAHPEMLGFAGNAKLIRDGAYPASNSDDLLDFWKAELWSK